MKIKELKEESADLLNTATLRRLNQRLQPTYPQLIRMAQERIMQRLGLLQSHFAQRVSALQKKSALSSKNETEVEGLKSKVANIQKSLSKLELVSGTDLKETVRQVEQKLQRQERKIRECLQLNQTGFIRGSPRSQDGHKNTVVRWDMKRQTLNDVTFNIQNVQLSVFPKSSINIGKIVSTTKTAGGLATFFTDSLMKGGTEKSPCLFIKNMVHFATTQRYLIFFGKDFFVYRIEFKEKLQQFSYSKVKLAFTPREMLQSDQHVFLAGEVRQGECVMINTETLEKIELQLEFEELKSAVYFENKIYAVNYLGVVFVSQDVEPGVAARFEKSKLIKVLASELRVVRGEAGLVMLAVLSQTEFALFSDKTIVKKGTFPGQLKGLESSEGQLTAAMRDGSTYYSLFEGGQFNWISRN